MVDDPYRKSQDRDNKNFDGGYLFGASPRRRHLRVLLDSDTLTNEVRASAAWRQITALCKSELVEEWRISLTRNGSAPPRSELGVVYLDTEHDPEKDGWAALPGTGHSWELYEHDLDCPRAGFLTLPPRPPEERASEDVARARVLAGIARAVGADLVISCSPTVGRSDLAVNYDTNFFTPEQASRVVAHYLRTQHVYLLPAGPTRTSRHSFYESALWAIAPGVFDWLAKCQQPAAEGRHIPACSEMINRLLRSVRAFDDLVMHIGQASGLESREDASEALDLMLLMLCGAVDVLVRSLHQALKLAGEPRQAAKLHVPKYYSDQIRPVYEAHADIAQLDELHTGIQVVFELRNTVHNLSLRGVAGGPDSPFGVSVTKGRRTLIIPPDSSTVLLGLSEDHQQRWGVLTDEGVPGMPGLAEVMRQLGLPSADIAKLAAMALSSTLKFLDLLCRILASTNIADKDIVLAGTAAKQHPVLDEQTLAAIANWINLPSP